MNPNSHLSRFTKPSVIYPVIILFLEFFAWGLLTTPTLNQLNKTFGADTLLINGIIQGIKGFLSFLSAPLIGAFSDIKGRRPLLLITVVATCLPIPVLIFSPYWFFTLLALSGIFSVTYTIVFAYVSDITDEAERNSAFGLVSATFAASLVISPAIGTLIEAAYGPAMVVAIATVAAAIDVVFILLFVPESLGYKKTCRLETEAMLTNLSDCEDAHDTSSKGCKSSTLNSHTHTITSNLHTHPNSNSNGAPSGVGQRNLTWDQIDPFRAIRQISTDKALWMISLAVTLSYMPEAGQYNSFMLYLMTMVRFSAEEVSLFIAWVGTLAVMAQVFLLTWLTNKFTQRTAILIGLCCQFVQLIVYAFSTNFLIIWLAAILLATSSIVYPAMNGWCSLICDQDNQGVIQGILTGIRGLCTGIGPAIYGLIFHLFGVDLEEDQISDPGHNRSPVSGNSNTNSNSPGQGQDLSSAAQHLSSSSSVFEFANRRSGMSDQFMPGPPFLFAAVSVMLSIFVVIMIDSPKHTGTRNTSGGGKSSVNYERLRPVDEFERDERSSGELGGCSLNSGRSVVSSSTSETCVTKRERKNEPLLT